MGLTGSGKKERRAKETRMTQRLVGRWAQIAVLMGMFVAGFFCGSISQKQADAQLKDLGKTGGVVGTAAELGSSVVEMQQHVNGLQKNLDTLKKIQSALPGGR
jgi:hypothetical protein